MCGNGHAFDRAKEGSVHLLPQALRSKAEGDSKEMLRARRALFDAGHFAPLQEFIAQVVPDCVETVSQPTIVDVGCGEGAYLGAIVERLTKEEERTATALGFDVASYGVKRAAARHKSASFFVGDIYCGLPLKDASADVVTNIFSPRAPHEFARILRKDGALVSVFPRTAHLAELREVVPLISIEDDKEARLLAQMKDAFDVVTREDVEWSMTLSPADALRLVDMTPSARHLTGDDRESLLATDGSFDVTGAIRTIVFRKR